VPGPGLTCAPDWNRRFKGPPEIIVWLTERPLIPDCTYVEITDSDHMVYVDNPKEFDPAFDAWLEER